MKALLRAAHPEPSLAVTSIVSALALAAGVGWRAVPVAAAVLAGQLSVGWSNDWADADRDRATGRTDKPVATGQLDVPTVRAAAFAALAACAALSALLGLAVAAVHLVGVAMGWAYNLWFKFTLASVAPYAVAFGLVPVVVALAADGPLPPAWMVAGAALLGAGGHFTQALPDLEDDAVMGVRGLPQRLGPRGTLVSAGLCIGGSAAALGFFGADHRPGAVTLAGVAATLVLVGGLVVAGLRGRPRLAFRLTIAAAGAVLVALLGRGPLLGA